MRAAISAGTGADEGEAAVLLQRVLRYPWTVCPAASDSREGSRAKEWMKKTCAGLAEVAARLPGVAPLPAKGTD
jgi:hypothetical protein